MGDGDCPFCRIVAGSIPASIVSATATTLAFLDVAPMTPGHTLIVPRAHAAALADLDPDVGGDLFREALRIASAIERAGLRADGISLFLSDRAAAGQDVDHVHLHVVPRYPGDGITIDASFAHPPRDVLDATAATIRDALA